MLAGLRARAPKWWRIILKLRPAPGVLVQSGAGMVASKGKVRCSHLSYRLCSLAGLKPAASGLGITFELRPAPDIHSFSPGRVLPVRFQLIGNKVTHRLRPGSALMTQAELYVNIKL